MRRRLAAILIFFAWGFVMHAVGLLVHELLGHGLAAVVLACGIDGVTLTFFGHGQVHYAPCSSWTTTRVLIADWAGLVLTSAIGVSAMVYASRRRPALSALARLLLSLVAFFFLLGQLGYATSGGFHDLYDPGRTARLLGARGLHPLAWIPPLLAYTAAAFFCAREAIDAFREHVGASTRRSTIVELFATLGVAGLLYFIAFRIEWAYRLDIEMRGVAVEAARVAERTHAPPPFPIERVLTAVALSAVVVALARRVRTPGPSQPISRRLASALVATTVITVVLMIVLILR